MLLFMSSIRIDSENGKYHEGENRLSTVLSDSGCLAWIVLTSNVVVLSVLMVLIKALEVRFYWLFLCIAYGLQKDQTRVRHIVGELNSGIPGER